MLLLSALWGSEDEEEEALYRAHIDWVSRNSLMVDSFDGFIWLHSSHQGDATNHRTKSSRQIQAVLMKDDCVFFLKLIELKIFTEFCNCWIIDSGTPPFLPNTTTWKVPQVKLFRESLHDKAPEQVQPDAQHQLQLDVAPKNRKLRKRCCHGNSGQGDASTQPHMRSSVPKLQELRNAVLKFNAVCN